MKNKRGMEMTINTVIALVLALVLLAFGIYTIYSKIYKPTETSSSFYTCEAQHGIATLQANCAGMTCSTCPRLASDNFKGAKENPYCCIPTTIPG